MNKPFSAWVSKSKIMPNNLLYVFLEEVTKWVDDGSPVDVIIFGFSEFDKVPHQRLILKFN